MRRFAQAFLDTILEALMAARPDVVLYGCTSATMAMGPDYDRAFRARIEAVAGVPAVTAAGALVEALDDLDAEAVGFCSPYTEALAHQAAAFLEAAGRRVVGMAHVGTDLDNDGQGALTPAEVLALARRADHPEAEAIVLSCTDMRAVETIAALEEETGKPAVTSNQAMVHAAISRLGLPDRVPGRLGEAAAGATDLMSPKAPSPRSPGRECRRPSLRPARDRPASASPGVPAPRRRWRRW